MKEKKLSKFAAVIFLLIFFGGREAWAQGEGFWLQVPAQGVSQGQQFSVILHANTGSHLIKYYKVRLRFNDSTIRLLYPKGEEWLGNLEFTRPISGDLALNNEVILSDTNNYAVGCNTGGTAVPLAELIFSALKGAPSRTGFSTIAIEPLKVINCNNEDITSVFTNNLWGGISINPPQYISEGVTQYLDLNGDGLFNYTDSQMLSALVSGEYANTLDLGLNIGGLQGDINGNGQADLYDVGLMHMVARPISWCSTGSNGIAQTVALTSDVQRIPVGQGEPDKPCVSAGANLILDTFPSGDDTVIWDWISTGSNGICESIASGDDVQEIPYNQGYPYAEMITPGEDGEIETVCDGGDDSYHYFTKDTSGIMATNAMPGRPARLVKVYPLQNPLIVRRYTDPITGQLVIPPVPLMVRVEDENGNPKPALAPTFTVTGGSGTFDGPSGQTTVVEGVVSDEFLQLGKFPEGTAVVTFHPSLGSNTVRVSLASDPSKGVPPLEPVTFNIVVLDRLLETSFPNNMSIQVSSHNVPLGEEATVTIQVRRDSTPVSGLADRLVLLSKRNLLSGVDARIVDMETGTVFFVDQFEDTVFPVSPYGTWQIVTGGQYIQRDQSRPGIFGNYSLHISGRGVGAPIIIQHGIDTSSYYGIQLGYQWSFDGDERDGDYFKVSYSTDGGVTWNDAHYARGSELYCISGVCSGRMILEHRNLWGDASINRNTNVLIRFTFSASTEDEFWLDNVTLAGVHLLWEENFDDQVSGLPPAGFDSVDNINSGADGVVETTAGSGDVQVIPVGQGEPYSPCVYAGLDNTLDTPLGGDDEVDEVGNFITSGANGICESSASGDDFQQIPVGQGKPFATAITSGSDMRVTTLPQGDDESQLLMGPDPAIVVVGTRDKSVMISRSQEGTTVAPYVLRKVVNVADMENVWLITRFINQSGNVGGAEPGQKFLCEVSDNGGKSFVTVWDVSDAEDIAWQVRKVCLSCDPRIRMVDGLIIQWRAVMDSTSAGQGDVDFAQIDEIQLLGTPRSKDRFSAVRELSGQPGTYVATVSSIDPGTTWISAMLLPYSSSTLPIVAEPADYVNFYLRKVEPKSVRIVPSSFTVKACQTLQLKVLGHYVGMPGTQLADVTPLYNFMVHGPARVNRDGLLTADCFTSDQQDLSITVNAVPMVEGLYDPGGGGEGQQTGYIDGKVFTSTFPYSPIQGSRVRILGNVTFSQSSASDGTYFQGSVPVYTNYTVQAMKAGKVGTQKTSISVEAGKTTTVNLFQASGSDTDGDTVPDSSDTDDDNDSLTDSAETGKGTTITDPDTDGDGYGDSIDLFPTNASEWADNDGDTVGDNSDTDDDNDGVLDVNEESVSDGYYTNSKNSDTDGDTLSDGYEQYTLLTDPSLADTDGGGRNDADEVALGKNPRYGYASDDNYGPVANAGLDDPYAVVNTWVLLDGSATYDPEDDGIVYSWVQVGGPTTVTIYNSNSEYAYFTTSVTGTYTFQLQVQDTFTPPATGTPDTVQITVGTDSDSDGLSDAHESALGSNSNDADSDDDSIGDLHEFWNSTTNITTADVVCNTSGSFVSLFCWGDTNGDGVPSPIDLTTVQNYINGKSYSYAGVYPSNGNTADLNGDGVPAAADLTIMQNWINGKTSGAYPPASLTKITPSGSPTVSIGGTQTIILEVRNSSGNPVAGVGVVFTITGPGVLMGGRGDASGLADPDGGTFPSGSRWDISGAVAQGGRVGMTVKVTGAGTITVNAKIPKYSTKDLPTTLTLSPAVTINP